MSLTRRILDWIEGLTIEFDYVTGRPFIMSKPAGDRSSPWRQEADLPERQFEVEDRGLLSG